jgi:hypothetical protein
VLSTRNSKSHVCEKAATGLETAREVEAERREAKDKFPLPGLLDQTPKVNLHKLLSCPN